MNRLVIGLLTGVLLAGLGGCQKAGSEDEERRHKEVMDRLSALEKKMDQMGQARPAAAGGQQRPRPQPDQVYFVPVEPDDLVRGSKAAKVTIVEAFEFA
jgi:protein-disulfide isomerase